MVEKHVGIIGIMCILAQSYKLQKKHNDDLINPCLTARTGIRVDVGQLGTLAVPWVDISREAFSVGFVARALSGKCNSVTGKSPGE